MLPQTPFKTQVVVECFCFHRSAVVEPIQPKAMPVILTSAEEIDQWLTAPTAEALELQRPLADEQLELVAVGERRDRVKSPL